MNVSYAEIEEAALALDSESKLRLISGLGQSLDPTSLEREWCEEVQRRRQALRQGHASVNALDGALAKVLDEIAE